MEQLKLPFFEDAEIKAKRLIAEQSALTDWGILYDPWWDRQVLKAVKAWPNGDWTVQSDRNKDLYGYILLNGADNW